MKKTETKQTYNINVKKMLIDIFIIVIAITYLLSLLIFKNTNSSLVLYIALIIIMNFELFINSLKKISKKDKVINKILYILIFIITLVTLFSIFMYFIMKKTNIYNYIMFIGSILSAVITLIYGIIALKNLITTKKNLLKNTSLPLISFISFATFIMCLIKLIFLS